MYQMSKNVFMMQIGSGTSSVVAKQFPITNIWKAEELLRKSLIRLASRIASTRIVTKMLSFHISGRAEFVAWNSEMLANVSFQEAAKKTFWRSNARLTDDTLIIAEAAIDALSYETLFPSQHAMYLATCGGLSVRQTGMLTKLLADISSIKSVIIITDNDEGGDRIATKLQEAVSKFRFRW